MADYISGLPLPAGTVETQPRAGIIPSTSLTNSKKKKVRVLFREFTVSDRDRDALETKLMDTVNQVAEVSDKLFVSVNGPITEIYVGVFSITIAILGQKGDTVFHAQNVYTELVEEQLVKD